MTIFKPGDLVQHKATKKKAVIVEKHSSYIDKYLISIGLDRRKLEDGIVLENVENIEKVKNESKSN
jgi:hypothetical protein